MKASGLFLSIALLVSCLISSAADKTTLSQADKDVDALLNKMSAGGGSQNAVVAEIQKMGKSAVPRLLYHANTEFVTQKQSANLGGPGETFSRESKSPNPKRMMAIFLLQFAWSDEAVAALSNILKKDANRDARLMAFAALNKNSPDTLKTLLPELVKDQNPEIAGVAFEQLELQGPDENRILALLDKQGSWKFLEIYLPRYYSPILTQKTLAMVKSAKQTNEKISAIIGLISQNANSAEIRKYVCELFKSYDPAVRDISAEYLAWHGTSEEIPVIETALKKETDIYSAASLTAALKAIKRRASEKPGDAKSLPRSYDEAAKALEKEHTLANMADAVKVLSEAEAFEPMYIQGREQDEAFIRKREDRMKLAGLAFDMPLFSIDAGKASEKPAVADSLCAPVRNYIDPTRKAYGIKISPPHDFIRLGDTVGLRQTYLTVVSIGNGEVKMSEFIQKRGYTVIIEHTGADGKKFCSYYTHLSPFVHVRKGDIVSKGEKIGATGRHFTWENGGCGAHLYFAIYNGAFDTASDWPTYTASGEFNKGTKWVNPQQFIQLHMKK